MNKYPDETYAAKIAEPLEARIANLRAAVSTVAVRLHDNDEPRQVLASALEMALMDDDKAANPG